MTGHHTAPRRWHERWPPEALGMVVLAAFVMAAAPLNHDSAWYLVASRRLLGGDRLYIDLFDPNPPLVFWLWKWPVFIGERFGIADSAVVARSVVLIVSLSALAGLRVLSLEPMLSRALRSGLVAGFVIALMLFSFLDTGQRDQLAAILLFPYALLTARAANRLESPTAFRVGCGLLAAVGIALKPFFLLPWAAMELVLLASVRRVRSAGRIEVITVVLVQIVYGLLVVARTPEYLTTMVPLARATYGAYDESRLLIRDVEVVALLVVGVLALATSRLTSGPTRSLSQVLGAATLGFVMSYLLQAKGFAYHLLPAKVFGALTVVAIGATVAAAFAGYRRQPQWRRVVLAAALLIIGLSAVPAGRRVVWRAQAVIQFRQNPYPPTMQSLVDAVARVADDQPVLVLSTNVWPAFPVVNLAGAKWPYHFNCLWPIPAFYAGPFGPAYRRPADQTRFERTVFQTVVGDFIRIPPRLLIVDRNPQQQAMGGRQFDFVEYFSSSPEFSALFRRYRLIGRIWHWELFQLGP
jgi:hypothetical protein